MTIRISRELPLFNFERLDILCPESDIRVKFMSIRISRELLLFNFERLDELCPRIGHLCEKLWPFEFLESFRCSISSVSIYYVPKSNIRVKSYDHSNFWRASAVQFRAPWYIISANWTSVWKVMTIRISRELPLFNFERLDILCPESDIRVKFMSIRISLELLLFNFKRLDELCPRIGHPSEKLWPFEFFESLRFSISSVYMSYVPQSDFRVKSYDHSNFSNASAVQFGASTWVMSPNWTFVWKVMTIRISRELLLFNFDRLDILL